MKNIFFTIAAILCFVSADSQELKFRDDGTFKIAQFTDTHIDGTTELRSAESSKTVMQMCAVLDAERPDVAILTGDIVTGAPAADGWRNILKPLADRNIPFCVVLGNHDREQELSWREISDIVVSYPQSINKLTAEGVLADMAIEILDVDKVASVLYCLDSHDYSTVKGLEGYGWLTPDQIDWYRTVSGKYTQANSANPLPSLAFFHIALREFGEAYHNNKNTRAGLRKEDECPGELNTGMFAAMVECGDVMGAFVGHDHDIDYVVADKGIALGYGRYSGSETTYTNLKKGVRIISLTSGQRGFDTWIRERDGGVVSRVKFADGKIVKQK